MSLFTAIQNDDVPTFLGLLSNDAAVRERDELGYTTLHLCATSGNVAMLRPLLERARQLALNVDDAGSCASLFRFVS